MFNDIYSELARGGSRRGWVWRQRSGQLGLKNLEQSITGRLLWPEVIHLHCNDVRGETVQVVPGRGSRGSELLCLCTSRK